ncbi:hypothetical protein GCM10022222_84850 [Amycolatopsis ultiminotia]|uniref:Uncharacterized protein n=1 Tax=Amycolatopsis ultiminotia TaxID=543629 RepID=A0ABP6YT86_9PSEU
MPDANDTPTAAELHEQLEQINADHESYRVVVRDRAIRGYRDGMWTLDQLNASLTELGLEPHTVKHVARSTLMIRINLHADIPDRYEAHEAMRAWLTEDVRSAIATIIGDHVRRQHAVGNPVSADEGRISASVAFPIVEEI